jgi:phosphatidylserine/phosphatidylglycerophosphate/cardiolipin synthase-like enzyme
VFFNGSIDTDVSSGTFPNLSNSPAAIQAEMIKRIDSARTKIDCSVYNNNTSAIVTALNNAHNRGVRVRYIADDGTTNSALSAAQFPVLYVNTQYLKHNKFMMERSR